LKVADLAQVYLHLLLHGKKMRVAESAPFKIAPM
jgi:hypothetical protein